MDPADDTARRRALQRGPRCVVASRVIAHRIFAVIGESPGSDRERGRGNDYKILGQWRWT